MVNHNKKLIVFDTDGVIFKSQLLLRISRSAGILKLYTNFVLMSFVQYKFYKHPLMTALIVSAVSCIIETLPIEFDNITIPLGTGLFLGLII